MNKKLTIHYKWECNEGIDIPKEHEEALEEDAVNRVFEMMKDGYYNGELHSSVRFGKDIVPDEDESDGLTYSGWWSISRENQEE